MKTTRAKSMLLAVVAVLMVSASFMRAIADNDNDSNNDKDRVDKEVEAPAAVLTAFHKSYPSAKILKIFMEIKGNVSYFEIESMDNSKSRDLLYFPDGSVYEIEEPIDIKTLPAGVLKSIKGKYPNGIIQEAEKIMRQGAVVEYGVILEVGESDIELLMSSQGVIKTETSVSEDDDGEENDEAEDGDSDSDNDDEGDGEEN